MSCKFTLKSFCTYPTRLEDEGNQNQKLMSERTAADNKIKGLEEQMTLSEDNISKVGNLLKILNSVSHTAQEKDLFHKSIFVITNSMRQQMKDVRESSYDFKIFSSNCVLGSVKALGFKDIKRVSNKLLITDFMKFLTIEDDLRDVGSPAWYKSHGIFMRNDFVKHLTTFVSCETATILQKVFKCKKQFDFCGQKLAGDEFGIFDSKIAGIKSNFKNDSIFNINLNKGEAIINSLDKFF